MSRGWVRVESVNPEKPLGLFDCLVVAEKLEGDPAGAGRFLQNDAQRAQFVPFQPLLDVELRLLDRLLLKLVRLKIDVESYHGGGYE